jgi:hypothetical protein
MPELSCSLWFRIFGVLQWPLSKLNVNFPSNVSRNHRKQIPIRELPIPILMMPFESFHCRNIKNSSFASWPDKTPSLHRLCFLAVRFFFGNFPDVRARKRSGSLDWVRFGLIDRCSSRTNADLQGVAVTRDWLNGVVPQIDCFWLHGAIRFFEICFIVSLSTHSMSKFEGREVAFPPDEPDFSPLHSDRACFEPLSEQRYFHCCLILFVIRGPSNELTRIE